MTCKNSIFARVEKVLNCWEIQFRLNNGLLPLFLLGVTTAMLELDIKDSSVGMPVDFFKIPTLGTSCDNFVSAEKLTRLRFAETIDLKRSGM